MGIISEELTGSDVRTRGPPDGGWGWVCVVGRLYCQFCVLGTATAFGIIYVELIDYFHTSREVTAWIGSLAVGLIFLTGPLAAFLTTRFGIRKTTIGGTLLAFVGCFISWFATGITYLYISYGVLLGIGLGLAFVPSTLIVVLYFDKHRGLANAIASCGSGIGTLALPPLYTYLLGEYGWRGTLLLLSGLVLNGVVCAGVFRTPDYITATRKKCPTETNRQSWSQFFSLFCNPCFTMFVIAVDVAHLGYMVPFVHLPDMATQMGIEKYMTAYLISTMGVSNIVGRIFLGWVSDLPCVNVILLHGVSLMVCGVATVASPHLSHFYALAGYSVVQGVCIGWLFDITKSYNASFYLAGSIFILSGVMDMFVFLLHRRQRRKQEENVRTADTPKTRDFTETTYSYARVDGQVKELNGE
ncbi:monocarboxylate transporter 13-like [Haliotis asinina]|uniref:monocarboxylate transporter 13-like n=1 Tax=Haliotis asinina TaxID=109174 RepID=UPI003531BC46